MSHLTRLTFAVSALALWAGTTSAQDPRRYQDGSIYLPGGQYSAVQAEGALPRQFYYPYYYYPHSYWPQNSPTWPEPKGHPYVRPPAYMAYPAFKEPGWRYELWTPMRYYRGNHFWLDQF